MHHKTTWVQVKVQVRYDDVILPASYHYPSPELPTDLCSNPHLCHIVLLFVLLKKMAKKCSKKFSDTSCNRNLMVSDPDPDLTLRLGDSTNVGTEYSN